MNKPGIITAIPERRYRYGEFTVVVLGDIESSDGIAYRYIMAVLKGADPEPGLYLTAERPSSGNRQAGYTMRIVMSDGADVIATSPAWDDLDVFARDGLEIVSQMLELSDEVPYQLS